MKTAETAQFSADSANRPHGPRSRQNGQQNRLQALQDAIFPADPLVALVNDRPEGLEPLIGLSNELALTASDGWALIPYGDHPNTRGLQRFGKASATQMHGYFKSAWSRLKRAFVGMPIYRGHPDQADTVRRELAKEKDPAKRARLTALINDIERRYPDKTVYGAIADIEVREDGLAIKPVLTPDGEALVNEHGLNAFSPHWLGRDLPAEGGREIKEPIYLVSIGLTDRPNIAGTSLVNSIPESTMNKALIIKLLAALGRTSLTNEATDDQVNAEMAEALPAAQALSQRPEPTALANEQTARTTAETELEKANTALANEKAAHVATAKARNELLVGEAIRAGRITEAAKPVWLGRLERDFDGESTALANEAAAVKTQSRTGDLGDRKPNAEASDKFTSLVNERVAKGELWNDAWQAVKATKEGQALLEQMDVEATTTS